MLSHVSHVACHVSCVKKEKHYKLVEPVGGGCVIIIAYPVKFKIQEETKYYPQIKLLFNMHCIRTQENSEQYRNKTG